MLFPADHDDRQKKNKTNIELITTPLLFKAPSNDHLKMFLYK